MRFATTTRIALATIVAAGAVAPAALAGGEPKTWNLHLAAGAVRRQLRRREEQQPFTQPESGVTQIVVRGNGGSTGRTRRSVPPPRSASHSRPRAQSPWLAALADAPCTRPHRTLPQEEARVGVILRKAPNTQDEAPGHRALGLQYPGLRRWTWP